MANAERPAKKPQARHEEFASKIISLLEKDMAPWQQPWKAGEHYPPFNPVSGTVYSGINRVMLSEPDYADPRWMTFKHAQSQNYRVKKGSKSRPVIHWQWTEAVDKLDEDGRPVLDANGDPEKEIMLLVRPRARFFSVFHASQLEMENGQPIPPFEPKELEWNPHERAEAILEASGAKIIHDQRDRGFYNLKKDEIHLPPKENFANEGDYYPVAFHELGHWTRHPSRLNRENGPFGSEINAREELRVHIASWMMSQDLGIDFKPEEHHASYVKEWVKVLKDDPYEIMRACRDAERINQYVMSLDQQQDQAAEITFSELENESAPKLDGGQLNSVHESSQDREVKPNHAASRLNFVIEQAAGRCAAASDHEAMIDSLLDARKIIHAAQDSPDYFAPGTEIESTLLQHMAWETGRLTESNADIEGHAETLIYNLVMIAHIQGRRTDSSLLNSYRENLQRYADRYRLGADETALACGDLVSFKQDFDRGLLEWSVDATNEIHLCRENADHPWREPNEWESKLLESAGVLKVPPIIRLNDGQFLTYDGKTHDAPLLAQEQERDEREDNPVNYLGDTIEQITRLNTHTFDEEGTRSALATTKNLLIKAVASPSYNAPGTEVESAIIKSMHHRCSLHNIAADPKWLLDSLNYSVVALGNIQANRLNLEGKEANLAKMAEYNKDMGPQEMGLASGAFTEFKRDLDGKEKDWCWDRESGTVLCRENTDRPWRPLSHVEKSQLRSYDHEAHLVPVIRLADGQVMTYDGQLRGPSVVQEIGKEVDTQVIQHYLESSADSLASVVLDPDQPKSVQVRLLKEVVKNGRNIISRPAYNSVAHTLDAAMLKYIVHTVGSVAGPEDPIHPSRLPLMVNDILMMGQINAKLSSDHVTAGKFQAAIEANIRGRFADHPEKIEKLVPLMTGRKVDFHHGLPSGRQWCRSLTDGRAMYKNHDHDTWKTDKGNKLEEDFPGESRPILTPILIVDGKSFLTLDGRLYTAEQMKEAALSGQEPSTAEPENSPNLAWDAEVIAEQTSFVNGILNSVVRPNLLIGRENTFKTTLKIVQELKGSEISTRDAKFNIFLDRLENISRREYEASIADSASEPTLPEIETRLANSVLEIIAAARELDYRGLEYAANELAGPKYRLVPLCPALDGDKKADLQHRGQIIRGLREAQGGESARVYAIVYQHGNEVISGFDSKNVAEGFAKALNGREISYIGVQEPRYSDEKIMLEVPFREKETAKALGATWDKDAKKWCARPGTDLTPLAQWIPEAIEQGAESRQGESETPREKPKPVNDRTIASEPAKEVVYLNVAYKQRREAKEGGAKWNAQKKLWYAPVGADLGKLAKFLPEKEPIPTPATSPVEEFRQRLEANGFVLKGDPIMDGKIHRVPIQGKPGQRDGAYQAYSDGVPNGWFENHRDGDGKVTKWVYSGQQLTASQKAAMQAQIEQRQEQLQKDRERQYAQAAERVFDKFAACAGNPVDQEHPYLKAKGVNGFDLHQDQDGNLLVFGVNLDLCEFPDNEGVDIKQTFQTLQTISPKGEKKFESGSRKTGAVHLIGVSKFNKIANDQEREPRSLFDDLKEQPEILLAEGYATGASLYKATGLPVAVAFDAGNLVPAAEALRRKFPKANLTICADNDYPLVHKQISQELGDVQVTPELEEKYAAHNKGVVKAMEAAKAVNGQVLVPQFTDTEKAKRLTDFNDLAQSRGTFAVTKQVSPKHRSQLASADMRHMADNPPQGFGLAM